MSEQNNRMLEKIYIEMQKMQKDIGNIKSDIINIKETTSANRRDVIRLENKLDNKTGGLFDGYDLCYEEIKKANEKIDKLTEKVDEQEIKLTVVK